MKNIYFCSTRHAPALTHTHTQLFFLLLTPHFSLKLYCTPCCCVTIPNQFHQFQSQNICHKTPPHPPRPYSNTHTSTLSSFVFGFRQEGPKQRSSRGGTWAMSPVGESAESAVRKRVIETLALVEKGRTKTCDERYGDGIHVLGWFGMCFDWNLFLKLTCGMQGSAHE